ncbi:unnamed protein product [Rotaria sordida]|uniref:non-specific serine/threonine protein kinase n=1 Tax=Rotaria sordida TaxID=392033 RepID=A0A814Q6X8_9BILA|nr:unnamed protein product [Rotaria sordida]
MRLFQYSSQIRKSVGCLLYEMCTYQHAFDGKGLMNVIYKVVEGKAPELPKTYSKELNDLLKKMLIKDPSNRPTAAQLLLTPFIGRHREVSSFKPTILKRKKV